MIDTVIIVKTLYTFMLTLITTGLCRSLFC